MFSNISAVDLYPTVKTTFATAGAFGGRTIAVVHGPILVRDACLYFSGPGVWNNMCAHYFAQAAAPYLAPAGASIGALLTVGLLVGTVYAVNRLSQRVYLEKTEGSKPQELLESYPCEALPY